MEVLLKIPVDLSNILPDGSHVDVGYGSEDDLLDAYTDSYEQHLREALPQLELVFEWNRNADGAGAIMCCCGRGHMGSPCEHEENINTVAEAVHLKALEETMPQH